VKDTPKIQVRDPDVNDHSITFLETGFRIPLALWGVFSYFPTSKPSKETLNGIKDVKLCVNMGTELQVLEEGTPWANRAELYIGLLKESDARIYGSPTHLYHSGITVANNEDVSTT
jgi:hypothetical protein